MRELNMQYEDVMQREQEVQQDQQQQQQQPQHQHVQQQQQPLQPQSDYYEQQSHEQTLNSDVAAVAAYAPQMYYDPNATQHQQQLYDPSQQQPQPAVYGHIEHASEAYGEQTTGNTGYGAPPAATGGYDYWPSSVQQPYGEEVRATPTTTTAI